MFYLITDQDNKSWREVQWAENVTHEEENPNYHFTVYNSPQTAVYMYPSYERTIINPKLWECSATNPSRSEGFRSKFPKLTSLREFNIAMPTNEQRITFSILCCLNTVTNPFFKEWSIKYLKGEDQTPESAFKMNEKLLSYLDTTWAGTPSHEYTNCCHAILTAIAINEPLILPASAAQRAYYDSLEFTQELNLEQTAQIVNIMPAAEIAALL